MKIFDSHFHIINPKYPLFENKGYLPSAFTVEDYQSSTQGYSICGGAVVSGSFQKFDQEYLINALKQMGDNFYGVANIPNNISEQELKKLSNSNIVAVRFNLKRGGSAGLDHMVELSNRLFEKYNCHTELYVDSKELKELKSILKQLPKFSIDHLGLSKEGLKDVYYWAENGVKIKATGFGRIDFDPLRVMKKIYSINPSALMFGTDLPSTRAKIPFSERDLLLIKEHFTAMECDNIFYNNALDWYEK